MKQKTKTSVFKKMRVTKNGKVLRMHIGNSHLKRKDDKGTKRAKTGTKELPYGLGVKIRKILLS